MKDLQAIRDLCSKSRFADALTAIEEVKQAGFQDAALLVLQGLALQMIEGDAGSLDAAESALIQAAGLDESHPEAHLEAGYYLLNVNDDAAAATAHFDTALNVLQGLVTDAVSGMAKCLEETGGEAEASKFLETAARRVLDPDAIKEKLQ